MKRRHRIEKDFVQYRPELTLGEAEQLLGVDRLPGDEKDVRDFLVLTERLLERNGLYWVRKNRENLIAGWQFHLRG